MCEYVVSRSLIDTDHYLIVVPYSLSSGIKALARLDGRARVDVGAMESCISLCGVQFS